MERDDKKRKGKQQVEKIGREEQRKKRFYNRDREGTVKEKSKN